MATEQKVLAYANQNFPRFVRELSSFVRFPSIGTDARYRQQTAACAHWLAHHLQHIGLQKVKVFPTPQHPIVYGEWLQQLGKPTLLIYGHYDVQPVTPLAPWKFAPFKPVVKEDYLYGRGASDDKGQLMAHVKALESFLSTGQPLPINVKCLFDGEEEMGSPSLAAFLSGHRHLLQAEVAVLSDMAMLSAGQPALTYALRGSLSLELEIKSQGVDLHSGNFGGAIHNPLQVAAELTAQLHAKNGRVAIPGFYDQVKTYSPAERRYMRRCGPTNAAIKQNAQANYGWGEPGYTLYERTTIRPALSVNGMTGGYQGAGVKAVIPASATVKLNFRLVPRQDPFVIERLFRQYIQQLAPRSVTVTTRANGHAQPYEINPQHPAVRAGKWAFYKGFGQKPVLTRVGGTIPAVSLFEQILGIPTVLLGFGLPDDHIHAPNERFYLPQFLKGIKTSIWFMTALSKTTVSPPGAACQKEWQSVLADR